MMMQSLLAVIFLLHVSRTTSPFVFSFSEGPSARTFASAQPSFIDASSKQDGSDATSPGGPSCVADETPKVIAEGLKNLDSELDKIISKKGWLEATKRSPQLVDDSHKLIFLRSEDFDAKPAAEKLVKYWDKRIEVFGDEKAFLPLTLDGAMSDDWAALSQGSWRLTGTTDNDGRAIIFADPSRHDGSKYSLESMARANWYIIHAALEDEQTQTRGCIFINYPKNVGLSQLNPRLAKMSLGSEYLPIRIAGFHICNPPKFFARVVFPVISLVMGSKYRKILQIHTGSDEDVMKELAECGIPRQSVPSDMPGGQAKIDNEVWLEARRVAGR